MNHLHHVPHQVLTQQGPMQQGQAPPTTFPVPYSSSTFSSSVMTGGFGGSASAFTPQSTKCARCNEQVFNISHHLTVKHGIGKFYKCLYCDLEIYNKQILVSHIFENHKHLITSVKAVNAIVYSDSFPFMMRDGSGESVGGGDGDGGGGDGDGGGGGLADASADQSSTQGGQMKKHMKTANENEELSSSSLFSSSSSSSTIPTQSYAWPSSSTVPATATTVTVAPSLPSPPLTSSSLAPLLVDDHRKKHLSQTGIEQSSSSFLSSSLSRHGKRSRDENNNNDDEEEEVSDQVNQGDGSVGV